MLSEKEEKKRKEKETKISRFNSEVFDDAGIEMEINDQSRNMFFIRLSDLIQVVEPLKTLEKLERICFEMKRERTKL